MKVIKNWFKFNRDIKFRIVPEKTQDPVMIMMDDTISYSLQKKNGLSWITIKSGLSSYDKALKYYHTYMEFMKEPEAIDIPLIDKI